MRLGIKNPFILLGISRCTPTTLSKINLWTSNLKIFSSGIKERLSKIFLDGHTLLRLLKILQILQNRRHKQLHSLISPNPIYSTLLGWMNVALTFLYLCISFRWRNYKNLKPFLINFLFALTCKFPNENFNLWRKKCLVLSSNAVTSMLKY